MRASPWYSVAISLATAVGGVFLMAGVGWAHHDEPTQARIFSSSLVRAYEPCDPADANAMTPGGLPACSPGEPIDKTCNMAGAGAKGRVDITPEQHDLRTKVDIHGITDCEGERLILFITLEVTSDNCVDMAGQPLEENCTVIGPPTIPLGDCIVTSGRCYIDTSLETLFPFISVLPDNDIGFRIDRCEVARATGPDTPPFPAFLRCGVLVP